MSKMIVKGVAFNPESKRHMELLNWALSEHGNFSSFVREMIAIFYESKKKGAHVKWSETHFDLDNNDVALMKKLL